MSAISELVRTLFVPPMRYRPTVVYPLLFTVWIVVAFSGYMQSNAVPLRSGSPVETSSDIQVS